MDAITIQQHRERDHYYTVQIEAEMQERFERTLTDLMQAMTEAMTSIRLGYTELAYQRLAVALERYEEQDTQGGMDDV